MSLTGRLTGIRAATSAPATKSAPPATATQNFMWGAPGLPMTSLWDADAAINVGYYGYIYHYRCARKIAMTIAGLPFRAGKDPDSPGQWSAVAPMASKLGPAPGGPTQNISAKQLWTWSIVSYLITGRWGWETPTLPRSNVPTGLWPLVSSRLFPILSDKRGEWFSGFQYQTNQGLTPLGVDDVFYAWRPSQNDWRQPESAMQAMALPSQIAVELDRFMRNFMRNAMVSPKMVVTPAWDDEEMRRSFQDQFLAEMTGVENAGRTAFAEYVDESGQNRTPNVQVVDLGTKPVDAQLIELQNWVRDTICDGWGLPVSILGQAAERTYENADQEHRNYWTGPILETIGELQDLVNIGLAPRFGDDVGWFDLSKVAALKPAHRFTQITAKDAVDSQIASVGEVREDMELPPEIPADAATETTPIPAVDDTPGSSSGSSTASGSGAGGRATSTAVDPGKVAAYLADNYPQRVLGWVTQATWEHRKVPLADIRMSRRPGGRDFAKVDAISQAIKAGKQLDPVVLVDTGEDKLEVADGYHRLLAYDRAGVGQVDAYVGSGVGRHGPWEAEMHDAKLNRAEEICPVHGVRAGVCTGDGPCDVTPLGTGKNWVTKAGGLPAYIRAVAHAMRRKGDTESQAIERAVGIIRNWAEGKGDVTEKTRERARIALAEWEALKAKAHAQRDGMLTETGPEGAGSLLPVSSPHPPARGRVKGKCGLCGRPVNARIHTMGRPRGTRHAGPEGHSHVTTGHLSGARRVAAKHLDRQASALEPAAATAMRTLFAAQRKATIDRLTGNRGKAMLRAAEPPPPDDQTPAQPAPLVDTAQIYDMAHWIDRTRDALNPLYATIAATEQPRLKRFPPTDASKEAVLQALQARSGALADSVSRTTFDQIQTALAQGVANGDSIGQLTAAINEIFDEADRERAEMIARTEVVGALNTAADVHAQALGPDIIAGKEWAATHDDRTRPTHREADGQIQSIAAPFLVGGFPMEHPGDPAAPPGEVINCRCASLYLTPAEYARRTAPTAPPIAA